jgi:hypothetical protein
LDSGRLHVLAMKTRNTHTHTQTQRERYLKLKDASGAKAVVGLGQ